MGPCRMPTFRNLNEVAKYLQPKINEALKKEVADRVATVQQRNIQATVYDAYNPKEYLRRSENGGLLDADNIKAELIEDGVLSVKNVTPPNPRYRHDKLEGNFIDYAVEYGKDYDFYSPGARPFVKDTIEDLRANKQHVEAMRRGLKRQGVNLK